MPEDEPPCHSSTPTLRLEKYAPTVSKEVGMRARWATWMATERADLFTSAPVSLADLDDHERRDAEEVAGLSDEFGDGSAAEAGRAAR